MSKCLICNEDVPEGIQVCPICVRKDYFEMDEVHFARVVPPLPNVELSFGETSGPNFLITYRRAKPLNKFQIWMFKICFGIVAKNL